MTQHYSKFIGLINNLDTATKASEIALNSQGSALIENAKALDSVSGKWNLLKTNLSNMKINLLDNDSLKTVLDLGIGITSLIDKIGLMNVAFATFGAIKFSGVNFLKPMKEAESFSDILDIAKGGMGKIKDEAKLLGNAFKTYFVGTFDKVKSSIKKTNLPQLATETRTVGVAAQTSSVSLKTLWASISSGAIVTKGAALALQGFKVVLSGIAGMGIGLLIGFVTEKLMKFIAKIVNAKDELKKFNAEARELTNTNVSNVTTGESALSELEMLERQKANASGTEKIEIDQRILELQKELASIFPETVTGYTNEGEAISGNIGFIKDFIEAKKEEMRLKAEDVLKENKGISETMKNIEKLENRRNGIKSSMAKGDKYYKEEVKVDTYNSGNKITETVTLDFKASEKELNKLNEELEREKELLSLLNQQVSALKSAGFTDKEIADLGYDVSLLNNELEKTNNKSNTQVAEISKLEQAYLDLGYSVSEVNEKMLSMSDVSEDGMNSALLQDSTKTYGESINAINDLRQSIFELNEEGAFTPALIGELLEQYPKLAELGAGINDAALVQEALNSQIADHTEIQNNAYQNMIANDKAYYSAKMKNSDEYLNHVNSAISSIVGNNAEGYNLDLGNYGTYSELKTGILEQFGSSTGSSINSLLDMYTKAYTFDHDNFSDLASAKQGFINATLPSVINWINEFTKRNSNGYTYDLSNFNTLAELKAQVISDLSANISRLQAQWNNARAIESQARAEAAKVGARYQQVHMDSWDASGTSRGDEGSYANYLKHQINTLTAQVNTVNKVFGGLEQTYNAIDSKFTGGNFTSGKVGSGGSGDKDAQDERVRLEEEANRKIEALRDKLINALKKKYDELRKKEIEPLDAEIKRKQEELDRLNNGGMSDTERLKALREELALWKKNDSVFAKDKIAELTKEVKEAELNLEIKNLEDKKEAVNNKYDALLQEEKLYAEASNLIQKGKYDEMKNLLLVYGEEFKDISLLLGESIASIIKTQLDELKEAYNFLKGGSSSSSKPTTSSGSSSSSSSSKPTTSSSTSISKGSKVKVKDVGSSIYVDSYGKAVGTWKGAGVSASESMYVVNTNNGRAALSRTNSINGALGWIDLSKIAKFKIGGDVGSWNSATDNGKMAIVHSGERVLTSEQNRAFSDLVYKTLPNLMNIPNNILGSLKNMNLLNGNGGGTYSLVFENNYNVTNETEMDVRNFQRKIQSDVEKNIKTALSKVGIRSKF